MTRGRRAALAAAGVGAALAILAGAASRLRPVRVTTDSGSRLLWLARGEIGRIRFVNSVTGRPVEIEFRIDARFQGFAVHTDAATEEYYGDGFWDPSERAGRDATGALRFCSVRGMRITLGSHDLEVKDGCLEVTLPWTPSSGA